MLGWFKKRSKTGGGKRVFERFNWEESTDLFSPEGGRKIDVKDISKGGIRFWSDEAIPKNTAFKIKINYNPIDFPLMVMVVRSTEVQEGIYEHGGVFVNVPREDMILLEDHLEMIQQEIERRQLAREEENNDKPAEEGKE